MYSFKKNKSFLLLVIIPLLLLVNNCTDRSEFGEASDYEKLGSGATTGGAGATTGACTTGEDTTAPTVSSASPTDNSTYNSVATTVAVTFSEKMETATVTTNTSDTTCSGSFQLSSDNFTSCIKMSAAPVASDNDTIFTITPASSLSAATTYKTKITTSVSDISCNTLGSAYTYNGFITSPSGSGTIQGSVKEADGSALSGVKVSFSIYGSTVTPDNTTTDSNGDYNLSSLGLGGYTLTYTKSGYLTEIQSDTLGTDGQTLTVGTITQLLDNCTSGTISGNITDAVTGDNVSSVDLKAYKGGTYVKSTTTNNDGEYSFSNMIPGWYDVHTDRRGYIDENFWAYSCKNQSGQDNSISTTLGTDVMRIVLKWPKTYPETAKDLDSNLYSPDGAGGWDRIYYSDNVSYSSGDNVTLDKDDTADSAPPGDETITISKIRSGTYIYQVHNWSDQSVTSANKANLKNSKAIVKVYFNDGGNCCTKKKYYVPNDNGTLWGVFTFNGETRVFTASDNMTTKNPGPNP
ncbi:MAG: Ig-like domain-containing protein [Anaerolineales bacterium]|nr:Ig-like domain-containing protein [Anaerolineales bacterium]